MSKRAPAPLSATRLSAITAHYFERFGVPSADHLRRVLARRVREAEAAGQPAAEARALVEAELRRLQGLRILDDGRTASEIATRMHRKGNSAAKIRQKLSFEGLGSAAADAMAARTEASDPELEAALTWARKHRAGPWRKDGAGPEQLRKEIARMGRAGFGYGVAKRVLGLSLEEEPADD